MMGVFDWAALPVARGIHRRDRKGSPPVPLGARWLRSPETLVLGHAATHSALTRRRRGPVAKSVVVVTAAVALSAAFFSAGMCYAGERADEQVAEIEAFYEARIQETAAARDARDVCLAMAEAEHGGGYWAGQWARLMEDPGLTACYAEEGVRAVRIRAEAEDCSFGSGP